MPARPSPKFIAFGNALMRVCKKFGVGPTTPTISASRTTGGKRKPKRASKPKAAVAA